MLKHLTINNYALIDHLSLPIGSGYSVITGETGAGKSIIMGALSLVLGQRSEVKAIGHSSNKCVVEAQFFVEGYGLEPLFEELELDYEAECLVRRELLASGKSRAFVNDTPVNLQPLKQITSQLIDIHSQHENLLLNESQFQMDLVDVVSQSSEQLNRYKEHYSCYRSLQEQLDNTLATAETWRKERDYAQYQFDKLAEANLVDGEQEERERELDLLNHAEEIKLELSRAMHALDNDEHGVLHLLRDAMQSVERVSRYLPALEEFSERGNSALIELKDIAAALEVTANDTEYDPRHKQSIEERLDLIYGLQQKHRVESVAALLALQNEYEEKLQRIDAFDYEIEQLQGELQQASDVLAQSAAELTAKRAAVLPQMQTEIEEKLRLLGMQNAQFKIELSTVPYTGSGSDKVLFLFSANKNAGLQPIASIASGGEIARVMLSLKSLIVAQSAMPTIIFDEIDTGVSGDVAQRMGEMMQQMGQTMQVITITHLPQIAARGKHHFKVYKTDTQEFTHTHLVALSDQERIKEIAEMMSGKNPTAATLKSAKELLSHR